jgi:hypothetical protein
MVDALRTVASTRLPSRDETAGLKPIPFDPCDGGSNARSFGRRDRLSVKWRLWRWPSRRLAAAKCDDHRETPRLAMTTRAKELLRI